MVSAYISLKGLVKIINFLKNLKIDSQEASEPLLVVSSTKVGNGRTFLGHFYRCVSLSFSDFNWPH